MLDPKGFVFLPHVVFSFCVENLFDATGKKPEMKVSITDGNRRIVVCLDEEVDFSALSGTISVPFSAVTSVDQLKSLLEDRLTKRAEFEIRVRGDPSGEEYVAIEFCLNRQGPWEYEIQAGIALPLQDLWGMLSDTLGDGRGSDAGK
jgi:hypothetical protein